MQKTRNKIANNTIFLLLSAFIFASLTGCKNFLDRYPLDEVSGEVYFKTESDLKQYTNSFYDYLPSTTIYSDDVNSDNIDPAAINELMAGTRTVPSSASSAGWTWSDIRNINYFLDNYQKAEIDITLKNHYAGIARFFRAYCYFLKLKKFGDIPFYSHTLTTGSSELYKARDPRNIVIDSIIADLDFAVSNVNSTNGNSYVSASAALALKSRVCLYEGTWEKYHKGTLFGINGSDGSKYLELAAETALQLINSGKYTIYTTGSPSVDYRNLFTSETANPQEFILAKAFSDSYNITHYANAQFTSTTLGNYGITKDLVENFLTSDGKPYSSLPNYQKLEFKEEMAGRDPRLAQLVRTPGYTRIGSTTSLIPNFACSFTGYQPVKFVTTADQDAYYGNTNALPVIRYAEVLLNYAEAKAELGTFNAQDAAISLNPIRKRAGLPDFNINDIPSDPILHRQYNNTTDDLILAIRRERRTELALEGFRRDDLLRWREGAALAGSFRGMYFASLGLKDLSGDGVSDFSIMLYPSGSTSSSIQYFYLSTSASSSSLYTLSETSSGTLNIHPYQSRIFDESKDYLNPLPTTELLLNDKLTQNPNWQNIIE